MANVVGHAREVRRLPYQPRCGSSLSFRFRGMRSGACDANFISGVLRTLRVSAGNKFRLFFPYCFTSSTRRFFARPSSLSLEATGADGSSPMALSLAASTPYVAESNCATEELITGDSDDPPRSEETVVEMLRMASNARQFGSI